MAGDLISELKERFTDFFSQYKRLCLSMSACFAGVLLLLLSFLTAPGPEAYAAAEKTVAKWEESQDEESYVEMRKALKKVPSLEKKYAPILAQKLFQRNRLSDALELAHQSLKEIKEDAPFHAAYGETTLLIEQGSYQDALEQAVSLKEKMSHQCSFEPVVEGQPVGGELLFAHNLLRIASLQKELKNKPGEKAAWEELESFLKRKDTLSHFVFENFRDKGLDLTHYMNERKKHLTNSKLDPQAGLNTAKSY